MLRGRPARATDGCGPPSSKLQRQRSGPRTARWGRGTGASCGIVGTRRLSWRSRTRCSGRFTISSRRARPTTTQVPTTLTVATLNASRVAPSNYLNAKAFAWCSNPRPNSGARIGAGFSEQVLGQLQAHHQFPDLDAGERELALLGIAPGLQPASALLEKDPLPALELVGRHLALARHRVERFAPQQAQDQLRLPLDAPSFGELDFVRWTGWLWRCRGFPRLRSHVRPPWSRSS